MKKLMIGLALVLVLSACNSEPVEVNTDEFEGTYIYLSDDTSATNGEGIKVSNNTVTITSSGEFNLYGEAEDLQLVVNSGGEVTLNLNGISLQNEDGPAIYVVEAEEVTINLVANTTNYLADSSKDYDDEELTAVVYSKDDLVFTGTGSLEVVANYNDAISSNDDLLIESGSYLITSTGDAFYGKDSLTIEDGSFDVTTFTGARSVELENQVAETGGRGSKPGQGQSQTVEVEEDDGSQKAFKTTGLLLIENGSFIIDSFDDAIHSDLDILILDGSFDIETGDDGINAGNFLQIDGGTYLIDYAYEGLEGFQIEINDGFFEIYVYDDGINAATDSASTDMRQAGGQPPEPSYDDINYETDPYIEINGGYFDIVSDGDGIDANGGVFINGGEVYVSGSDREFPPDSGIDFDITAEVNGGTVLSLGGTMMSHPFSDYSEQVSVHYQLPGVVNAGAEVTVYAEDGSVLASMNATNAFQVVTFSSLELSNNSEITIDVNGSSYKVAIENVKMVTTNMY